MWPDRLQKWLTTVAGWDCCRKTAKHVFIDSGFFCFLWTNLLKLHGFNSFNWVTSSILSPGSSSSEGDVGYSQLFSLDDCHCLLGKQEMLVCLICRTSTTVLYESCLEKNLFWVQAEKSLLAEAACKLYYKLHYIISCICPSICLCHTFCCCLCSNNNWVICLNWMYR